MFNPNPAMPWFSPTGRTSSDPRGILPGDASSSPVARSRFRVLPGRNGPIVLDGDLSDSDATAYVEAYNQYLGDLEEMYAEAAGFERDKLKAQINDAQKARQNAMAIARLQAENSRYGADVGRQTALDQLKEQARQFDSRHMLDEQEFGLKYAGQLTDYLSTPDRAFQGRLFEKSYAALNQGRLAPGYRADGDIEQPNRADRFAALAAPQGGGAAPGGPTRQTGATTGASTDGRLTALAAIAKAMPPSNTPGYTARDFAALRAMGEVIAAPGADEMDRAEQEGIKLLDSGPGGFAQGQWQSLDPAAQKGLKSLAQTRGINWESFDARRRLLQPGQGSALSA